MLKARASYPDGVGKGIPSNPEAAEDEVHVAGVPEGDTQASFISVVLASTEDTWREAFRARGQAYVPPMLAMTEESARRWRMPVPKSTR